MHWGLSEGSADLWWVDDSCKGVHIVHAKVGDGEGATTHLLRPQLALLCLNMYCNHCEKE